MQKTDTAYHLRLSEFRRFSELVFNRTGVRFDMKRYDEVRLFVADRMRIYRMTAYEQYLQYVEDDDKNREVELAVERLQRERVPVRA
jgi:chemotaxis methyl-accepting protein methylase